MPVTKQKKSRAINTSLRILERLLLPKRADLTPEAARSILRLTFRSTDQKRVNFLSLKAQEGTLTSKEDDELGEYIRVADMLAMLQSKARLSLKKAGLPHETS
jgi:hypothetical protein